MIRFSVMKWNHALLGLSFYFPDNIGISSYYPNIYRYISTIYSNFHRHVSFSFTTQLFVTILVSDPSLSSFAFIIPSYISFVRIAFSLSLSAYPSLDLQSNKH
jgi:hypothetical protein